MKPMDNKSQAMKDVIESLFPGTAAKIANNQCPLCESPISLSDFKTPLDVKEYYISGMCQGCIDRSFMHNCEG